VETQECFFAPSLAVKVLRRYRASFCHPHFAPYLDGFPSLAHTCLLAGVEPGNRAQIRAQGIDAAMPPLVNPLPYRIITTDVSLLYSR